MKNIITTLVFSLLLIGCKSPDIGYVATEALCESIKIDSTITGNTNPELEKTINSYKVLLDKEMKQVIGKSAVYMENGKPESLLANFTADVLLVAGAQYLKEPVDIALINNGGLRAPLKKGDITVGDIYSVFPFENAMVILYMKGEEIEELFEDLSAQGGEGVAGCSFEFKGDDLKKLLIAGKPVQKDKIYKLVTIDYLAEGNSNLEILLKNVKRIDTGITLRSLIINYVADMTAQKKEISAKIEKRAVAL